MTDPAPKILSYDPLLSAPPDCLPLPPTITRPQTLPFSELTWENFERLCYRLACQNERVEHVARYGRSGQAQQGIDLFVRLPTGKYEVWQAKRYNSITAGDIQPIVDVFRKGNWVSKTERLILAIQASLADTKIQDAIEKESAALKEMGITLIPRDGDELSNTLRQLPALVDDFFGREWVKTFIGHEAADQLGARLDGGEFARVRRQLLKYYDSHFHLLDIGLTQLSNTGVAPEAHPSIIDRFAIPDVLVTETTSSGQPSKQRDPNDPNFAETRSASNFNREDQARTRRLDYVRRASLGSWLSSGDQLAVVGDAGSGKSTLLRCLALDTLTNRGLFRDIGEKWGRHLPIHVPFSRWSNRTAKIGAAASLKDVIAETLQPALTANLVAQLNRAIDERRILLLVDGLDEWADEQAARTTLRHILTFVATHEIPVIVTARPLGLNKIGAIPASWCQAVLAPLSLDQQRNLARVWFEGAAMRSSVSHLSDRSPEPLNERLERFFAELDRDKRLAQLAGTPLLLMGLVALSLRHITLPRNKTEAIERLTEILIDIHPVQRATEAGDTYSRFSIVPEAQDRRALLGHLAFTMRMRHGGGTFDLSEARRTIAAYLADPSSFAFDKHQAERAARELLSPNSETIGLVIERAPGEIAFAHAVFEEHLAAEHIRTWPFSTIIAFVREKSAQSHWRNTLSTLVCLLDRPTEVENFVTVIEEARAEDVNRQNSIVRELLLADIAFGPSRKPAATTQRLVDAAIETIEWGDWAIARREALRAALSNLGASTATRAISERISSWAPRRQTYLGELFKALASWTPTPELLSVLLGGLRDEERNAQREAARTLGRLFKGRVDVQRRLEATVKGTLDLSVCAGALEALSIGWPETSRIFELHDHAAKSQDPTLQLVGITGRVQSGRAHETDRNTIISLLSQFSELDYWDRPLARALLSGAWPDDPTVIDLALKATRRHGQHARGIEYESAAYYLSCCSPKNPSVANWVRAELREEYPFSLGGNIWDNLAPFANEHEDIRASIVEIIRSERRRLFLHHFYKLISELGGDEIRDALISITRSPQGLPLFWPVGMLLETWGRNDPVVASLLDEISFWEDAKLHDLAARLPKIIQDPITCRQRLFSIARRTGKARFDLIAAGFSALGCGADDTEVIDLLMEQVGEGQPLFDPGPALLRHFSTNAKVRQYALQTLSMRSPPLETLAHAYQNDHEIKAKILRSAKPLPAALRSEIVDAASNLLGQHYSLGALLHDYDIEVESELKIRSSIAYHRALARTPCGTSAARLSTLREDLRAVGPDLHERRAAAFAAMLILGRVEDVVPVIDYGEKLLHIQTGRGYGRESDSLMALIAARWEELSRVFGSSFASRFGDFGSDEGHLWDCLAPHLSASEAARTSFFEFVERTDTTLGLRSFQALARERPSSETLLRHCWRVLGVAVTGQAERQSAWAVRRIRLEIAYILRDQFRGRFDVAEHLREIERRGSSDETLALLVFNPVDPVLDRITLSPIEIVRNHADWVAAAHLAATRSNSHDFVDFILEMISRKSHDIWCFQDVTNRAIVERLRRDPAAVEIVKARLDESSTPNEIINLPGYLSAAVGVDETLAKRCAELLERETYEPLPRAGYDLIEEATQSVSSCLLKVIASPIGL